MTVCIAASCTLMGGFPVVVGASDRMITLEDVEFEPPQTKVYTLTNSIMMLIAGETAAQVEIHTHAARRIGAIVDAKQGWVFVEIAANIVGQEVAAYRRRLTERVYLEPFGLTHETFIKNQLTYQPGWFESMASKVLSYRPSVQTIVAGVDTTGAHLYVVDSSGHPTCHDAAGFAAIGSGQRHAESVMMFAGHTRNQPMPDCLFNTYAAKRESEVSPGVGEGTDMVMISGLGGYSVIPPVGLETLEALYSAMKKAQREARHSATESMKTMVDQATKAAVETMKQKGEEETTAAEGETGKTTDTDAADDKNE